MTQLFNVDEDWSVLCNTKPGNYGAIPRPREVEYGSANAPGQPMGYYPDAVVSRADIQETISFCHSEQIFPMYHQSQWRELSPRWNQDGLPYCWAWGVTGALMDCRAREGKETKLLSPVTLGHAVNWRSRGNTLSSAIYAACTTGVAEMDYTPDPHSRNYKGFRDGWKENAAQYRISEEDVFETSPDARLRHCLTLLKSGIPVYIAYNWWGHALELVGLIWDESQDQNVRWVLSNSHNEDDFLEFTGRRGEPDEAYGIGATLTQA